MPTPVPPPLIHKAELLTWQYVGDVTNGQTMEQRDDFLLPSLTRSHMQERAAMGGGEGRVEGQSCFLEVSSLL